MKKYMYCVGMLAIVVVCCHANSAQAVAGARKKRVRHTCGFEQPWGIKNSRSDFGNFNERAKPMKIIDISWPLVAGMTTYKNKGIFQVKEMKDWDKDHSRESLLTMIAHTGTHVDAPAHFLKDGKTFDQVGLDSFVGPCDVLDLSDPKITVVTKKELEKHKISTKRVLLKTKNSSLKPTAPFDPDFVYLDKTGAEYLKGLGVVCVGIDYLGIETKQPEHETHKILLGNDISIIEGLRLADVAAGVYTLVCLPLNLIGTEASLARAILIDESK